MTGRARRCALGGTRTPSLLIRRSGRIVQGRPTWSVRWGDLPQLSMPGRRCPPSWQQCWQQLRRAPAPGIRSLPYQVSSVSSSTCAKPGSGVEWLPRSSRDDLRWTASSGTKRARFERANSARWCREDPAACRVGSEGLKQRGRQPIRRGVRGGSPALQLRALQIRKSGRVSRIVRCDQCAGPTFHSYPPGTGVVQRLARHQRAVRHMVVTTGPPPGYRTSPCGSKPTLAYRRSLAGFEDSR